MAKKYGKKIRKATKKKIAPVLKSKPAIDPEKAALNAEIKRLKAVNQKIDHFRYAIDGKIDKQTYREYKQYLKHLKRGSEQLNIYEWKTQKQAHLDKARTWMGADRWVEGRKYSIGKEIATFQNNYENTLTRVQQYYNADQSIDENPKMSFEEWKASGGVKKWTDKLEAENEKLKEDGKDEKGNSMKTGYERAAYFGRKYFGSP